ncbi:TonB-dependent receptor [Lutibacter sp. B1]|uniref:SusC/RagA family TonB-linked outer membrane protein n=1 Tax=Lutibacter sp. B1 TaxID=2725996 RepID=UPI00145785D9|nr:TonB-dependent receptor [Lutibacter sp. B1]NLP56831.1 TonB-dependent receptor [Lutibacter sp. B1]
MKNFKFLLFNVTLLFPLFMFAQQTIQGTVTDATSGSTLPGVDIIIKGTTRGTSTDFDGNYTLENVKKGDVLVFSYIGFKTQEITVSSSTTINVVLQESLETLEEVVIVGYGEVKKKDKTGAAVKVSAADLNQGTLVDPIQALQGKAAGVSITKQGGDPNAGFNVRIRGAAGFAAGGDPLYVVNGVRGVDITTIAPEDIIAFDILKDAASTAIYGADGANGVVFVTTKSGKEGVAKIEYNTYVAIDDVANDLDLQSAKSYRAYINENQDKYSDFSDAGGNIDWQDEVYRTGVTLNNNFAISGGSDTNTYRASITNTDFEGVIDGSNKNRTTARIDLTQKTFDDKLKITMGLSGTIEENDYINYGSNEATDALFQSFQRLPTDPIYNADGSYFETARVYNYYNPVASLDQIQNERDAKKYTANLGLNYTFIEGLTGALNLSYLRNDSESTYFEPKYSNTIGTQNTLIRAGYGKRAYDNWAQSMLEGTLTYKKTFNDVHNLTALAGYSYRKQDWDGFLAEGREPISNSLGADKLQNFENIQLGDIESYKGERTDIGYFGRIMYDYDSKYYLTAMIRRDGSSVFGRNEDWGWFPSVQVAWNMANENFLVENNTINLLKLRASWGLSGNSNIDSYLYQLRVGPSGTSIDPETGNPIVNLDYYNNGNPDLKWDENEEINIGLDFGLFDNRISGSVEYYSKQISDMLSVYDVPTETNYSGKVYYNGGEMENTGFEATLMGKIFNTGNFKWNTTFTYSTNSMEIKSLDGGKYDLDYRDVGYISAPGIVGVATQRMLPKHDLGTFYGFEYAGVSDGKWMIKGTDNEIYYLDDVSQSDEHKKPIGNALPDFELGWSNNFTYKDWDLSMSFRAVIGHDIYNATKQVFGNPDYITQRNVLDEALDLDGYVGGAYQSLSYYVEDGSYLKLDNVNLGYTFPKTLVKGISKLRVYASINNVFTLTNYDGIDPEVNYSGGDRDKGEIYFGIDQYNIYPKTRTITFGLNVEL